MATAAGKAAEAAPDRKTRFDHRRSGSASAPACCATWKRTRIGVPTLQVRIADAAGRSQDLIPLKTLQRFLAGATRTNDAFLIPCHQFASGLPDYGGPKEVTPDELARALGWFLNLPAQEPQAPGRRLTG